MGKGLQLPLRKQGVYTVSLFPEIFLGLHTNPTHEVANLSTKQAGNLHSSPRGNSLTVLRTYCQGAVPPLPFIIVFWGF